MAQWPSGFQGWPAISWLSALWLSVRIHLMKAGDIHLPLMLITCKRVLDKAIFILYIVSSFALGTDLRLKSKYLVTYSLKKFDINF